MALQAALATRQGRAMAALVTWQEGEFGSGEPSALRLIPHNPHQALYRLRAADLTRASRRAVLSEGGSRGYIHIWEGRTLPGGYIIHRPPPSPTPPIVHKGRQYII